MGFLPLIANDYVVMLMSQMDLGINITSYVNPFRKDLFLTILKDAQHLFKWSIPLMDYWFKNGSYDFYMNKDDNIHKSEALKR